LLGLVATRRVETKKGRSTIKKNRGKVSFD